MKGFEKFDGHCLQTNQRESRTGRERGTNNEVRSEDERGREFDLEDNDNGEDKAKADGEGEPSG